MRRPLLAVAAAWTVSMLSIAGMVLASLEAEASVPGELALSTFTIALTLVTGTTATVGWLLVARRPGNRIGLLLATGGTLLVWAFLGFGLAAARWRTFGAADVPGGIAALIGNTGVIPGIYLAFPAATVLFPNGRLPGDRWRWPFAATLGALVVGAILSAVSPWSPVDGLPDHPFPLPVPADLSAIGGGISAGGLIASLPLALLSIVVRFRRSRGLERAQIKWLLAALTVAAVLFPLSWATDLGPDEGGLVDVLSVGALGLVPLAILVAVLRYRLYEIDRLISRSLSWGIVTAVLVGVFVVLVVGLQALLGEMTQGSTLAVAASTLAAFALFQPLRRRVQRIVDRRFDRGRYDAERTASAFAERVRDRVDLDTLSAELLATASGATRPAGAAIWLSRRVPR